MNEIEKLQAIIDAKNASIREAHREIRRLEALAGSSKPMDGLAELLSSLSDTVRTFWKYEAGGVVYDRPSSDADYGGFGAGYGRAWYEATLICVCDSLENEKKFREMQRNLDLFVGEWVKEHLFGFFKDTPKNRKWITELLTSRFPTLQITNWEVGPSLQSPDHLIRSLHVRIDIGNTHF